VIKWKYLVVTAVTSCDAASPASREEMQNKTKRTKIIKQVLAKIKPYLKAHGGDVELAKIEGKTVTLQIKGACVGCPLANLTYNKIVRELIKEKVPEIEKVIFK
jgi:NifU-like protein